MGNVAVSNTEKKIEKRMTLLDIGVGNTFKILNRSGTYIIANYLQPLNGIIGSWACIHIENHNIGIEFVPLNEEVYNGEDIKILIGNE